jgi:hypothetical protein
MDSDNPLAPAEPGGDPEAGRQLPPGSSGNAGNEAEAPVEASALSLAAILGTYANIAEVPCNWQ